MRIPCPHCGDRDSQEFVYRGDAAPVRPPSDASEAAYVDYVYLRENPAGAMKELWYHAQGCRQWLVVERDIGTHQIHSAAFAREGRS